EAALPPEPPEALLYALAASVVNRVVAVAVALPPLAPKATPLGKTTEEPPPPLAFAVFVASGPGPGPALAVASEPGLPGAPMTVTVSAYAVVQPSTKDEIKASTDRHCR